ncbi:MAG: hypothetical protein IT574_03170 [Candidatus Aureabacteria bacterium]|nr:hypothetical protein [Candidatus Auribacterota bacterium]
MQPSKLNRYVYCQNNPINMIDPLGLQEEEAGTIKELGDGEIEEEETSAGSRTEREKEKTKAEIDRSDLSDREKRELKNRIDDMSVGEFKEWQRAQERAAEKAERSTNYKEQLRTYGASEKGTYSDPRKSPVEWGRYALQEGRKYGMPYAHVLANAGLTRDWGAGSAWTGTASGSDLDY